MALKAAVKSFLASASSPQDITDADAGFSTDVKAALFVGASQGSLNGTSAIFRFNFGVAGNLGGNAAMGMQSTDNVATQDTGSQYQNTFAMCNISTTGGGTDTEWTVGFSDVSTGIRLTYSDVGDGTDYFGALMLGGDIEAKVVTAQFTLAGSPDTQSVAHGLSGAPEIIIALTNMGSSPPDDTDEVTMGFWVGGVYASTSWALPSGGAGGASVQQVRDDCVSGNINTTTGAMQGQHTISNVGGTTFDVSTSGTENTEVSFLCLRGTSAPLVAECGIYDTPTGTGNVSMGLSLSAAPRVLLLVPTKATAVNSALTDATAGGVGMFFAANNAGAGTQDFGIAANNEDGATPNTNNVTTTRDDSALYSFSNTGAQLYGATVNAWQSDDVQLNFSVADGTSRKVLYLAIGQSEGGGIGHQQRLGGGFISMNGNTRG